MLGTGVEGFWCDLHLHGGRSALKAGGQQLSYADLAVAADDWAGSVRSRLPHGLERPLVCLELPRRVAGIVAYIGCLRAGWPVVLLAEGEARDGSSILVDFRPNVLVRWNDDAETIEITDAERASFCDGLAVLLSTSGTTGASKLVKLSQENIEANARSIVEYLGITADEVAITTLPLHYSFGMSVLHSHLRAGACLVVCDTPLTEPQFWETARAGGVTSLAMVPTQYELLERIGFTEDWLPSLRSLTQAGGRLDPLLAQRFALRAAEKGWRLFLMYGQTEASPRIAYLPPEEAVAHFDKTGRAVPGGTLTLEEAEGRPVQAVEVPGELVYSGPNVMIGYAMRREDLARPKDTFALRTGDIAVRTESGHFRIVGRTSRFVKLNGLRIGLDEVERVLQEAGHRAFASGDDRGLVVFVPEAGGEAALGDWLAERFHVMRSTVQVQHLVDLPLLASGKVDYRSLRERADAVLSQETRTVPSSDFVQFLARVVHQPKIDPLRSFNEIGGDSLAFLEVELFLSKALGQVPDGWEKVPIWELADLVKSGKVGQRPGVGSLQRIGTEVPIRVLAIFWVIMLHSGLVTHGGGVYALIMLAGYSFAKHQHVPLTSGFVWRTVSSILPPLMITYIVLLVIISLHFEVDWKWFAFIANFWVAEDITPDPGFIIAYWFVSAYVQAIVLVSLPFLFKPVRSAVAREPFLVGILATSVLTGIATLWPLVPDQSGLVRLPDAFLALFGLGWCIAMASTKSERLGTTVFAIAAWFVCWRHIDMTVDIAILIVALLMLWLPRISLPGLVARGLREVAALTMFIYLLHVPSLYVDGYLVSQHYVILAATVFQCVAGAVVARWIYGRVELHALLLWEKFRHKET